MPSIAAGEKVSLPCPLYGRKRGGRDSRFLRGGKGKTSIRCAASRQSREDITKKISSPPRRGGGEGESWMLLPFSERKGSRSRPSLSSTEEGATPSTGVLQSMRRGEIRNRL